MQYEWERREVHTKFWYVDLKDRPLGRPRHRWEHNIEIDLKEIGREGVDCIHLSQDRDK
jgi:hypothetical protein